MSKRNCIMTALAVLIAANVTFAAEHIATVSGKVDFGGGKKTEVSGSIGYDRNTRDTRDHLEISHSTDGRNSVEGKHEQTVGKK